MTGGRRALISSVPWLHSQVGLGTCWQQQSQLRGGGGNKIDAERRGKVLFLHPHLGSSDSSSSCLLWDTGHCHRAVGSPGPSEQAGKDSETGPSDRNAWIFWETAR